MRPLVFHSSPWSGIKGGWAAMTSWCEFQMARCQWQLLPCELLAPTHNHLAATSHTRIWPPHIRSTRMNKIRKQSQPPHYTVYHPTGGHFACSYISPSVTPINFIVGGGGVVCIIEDLDNLSSDNQGCTVL